MSKLLLYEPVLRRAALAVATGVAVAMLSVSAFASGYSDEEMGEVAPVRTAEKSERKVRVPRSGKVMTAEGERTLAPYFMVRGAEGSEVDPLPLRGTEVHTKIAGVIADVEVVQRYKNAGKTALEAVYIFPGSTRAAVHGLEMTVGDRHVVAEIREKGAARKVYEQAKSEGKTASLLEEHRPNVFQMNLANILPGDEVEVKLQYSELLLPEEGVYEFVFPTVVGPRYSNRPAASAQPEEHWVENPYLKAGEKNPATFAFDLALNAGMPVATLNSPSHDLSVSYQSQQAAQISLSAGSEREGNRDVVIQYRLAGDQVRAGLVLQKDFMPGPTQDAALPVAVEAVSEKENFFLLTVQPPQRVTPAQVPPREYIFIVDVSGSMDGFPLNTAKELMTQLLTTLKPQDTFNVELFASAELLMSPKSVPATAENIQRALALLEQNNAGGATELLHALSVAENLPRTEGVSRSMVLLTDGYVDVEREAFSLVRSNVNRANFFAFGIGSSVNRALIEGLSRAGQAEPFVVLSPEQAPDAVAKFRRCVESPVLTGIQVTADGFDAYDLAPSQVADVMALRPVVLCGKWRGEPKGKLVLTGKTAAGDWRQEIDVAMAAREPALENNTALSQLWARRRIDVCEDENNVQKNDEMSAEITRLGLAYHLLTPFTSFVAVDQKVRRTEAQKLVSVKQPLPLPKGVPNSAVGGSVAGSTPVAGESSISSPEVMSAPGAWLWVVLIAGYVVVTQFRIRRVNA